MDKCDDCIYKYYCDEIMRDLCQENDYVVHTTKEDKEYCDMLCGDIEENY